jgi:site-specific recombinase XerD
VDSRFLKNPKLKPDDPLILNQKGLPYSPNALQDHMSHMLKYWAGIERASSHSGRCSLATALIHEQGEHLKTVQQILGYNDASVIYRQLPETEAAKVLSKFRKYYKRH